MKAYVNTLGIFDKASIILGPPTQTINGEGIARVLKNYIDNTFVHIGGAFLCMGAWAYFANRFHPPQKAILAAVLQGTLSATITFFMKKTLEGLSAFFIGKNLRWPALIATPLIACTGSLILLVGAHVIAKTPELFATVALPFSVAFLYACTYSL